MEIKPVSAQQLPEYAEVIRSSFATVAQDFGFTRENCPRHTSFITNERLQGKFTSGYTPFACFDGETIVGFVSLTDRGNGVFELNDLSVLPAYRHLKYGKALLDFCKAKVAAWSGRTIKLELIEENTTVKNWYAVNGFVHTGAAQYEGLPFTVGSMEWSMPE